MRYLRRPAVTLAGIGVFDLLHGAAITFLRVGQRAPSPLLQALTGLGFLGLASAAPPAFGACLVCASDLRSSLTHADDLLGLAAGQTGQWQGLLGLYAVATGAISTYKYRSLGHL